MWGLYDQNVAIDQLLEPGYTLCWAAKWHGEKDVMFSSILDGEKKMVRKIHKLMGEADAICHYNGNKFDVPTLNKEFLLSGLPPPSPSKQIDLLMTARKQFRLASNKLDFVAGQLGLGNKTEHKGMKMWLGCMNKDPACWRVMEKYNKQDVKLLERVYDRLLPWISNHPNLSAMSNTFCCPRCNSQHYQQRGEAITLTSKYKRYQCLSCGGWFRINLAEPRQKTRGIAA